MNKKIITLLAATIMSASTAANAEVFTYNLSNGGSTLTINTATGQGSLVGSNINASFTSPDFSSFTGGPTPDIASFALTSLTGTRTIAGNTFNVTNVADSPHPYQLNLEAGGEVNLWAFWGGGTEYGDYRGTTTGYTPPAPPTTTSSGGFSSTGGVSSSSSTGGSGTTGAGSAPSGVTGGADVPAPGALLLFGLGAAGLAFAHRRRKQQS